MNNIIFISILSLYLIKFNSTSHRYLDFVTIMTHDFYENPLKLIKFRHYAPLFGSTSRQSEVFDTTSQNVSVSYWISRYILDFYSHFCLLIPASLSS